MLLMATSEENVIFEDLFEKYGNMVYRICLSIVKNHHAALDLTQEVFIQAYRKRATIRTENLQGWLRKTAKNKSINYYRKNKRSCQREVSADNYFGETLEIEATNHVVFLIQEMFSTNPEDSILFKELVQQVATAIDELEVPTQNLILEHLIDGKSLKAIAESYGMNQQTAYTKARRAKIKIANRLGNYLENVKLEQEGSGAHDDENRKETRFSF